jgi:putative transposase
VTTIAGDVGEPPDLLRRDFTADAPATKLVGDITYIRTWEGWLYLATVLDCFSKKVMGYAMAEHMRAELVSDALRMAARNVPFRRGETIFHGRAGRHHRLRRCYPRPAVYSCCTGASWRCVAGRRGG